MLQHFRSLLGDFVKSGNGESGQQRSQSAVLQKEDFCGVAGEGCIKTLIGILDHLGIDHTTVDVIHCNYHGHLSGSAGHNHGDGSVFGSLVLDGNDLGIRLRASVDLGGGGNCNSVGLDSVGDGARSSYGTLTLQNRI